PQAVSVSSSGSVPDSNSTGPLAAGSYGFLASYSGDANYGGSTGTCEALAVAAAPTDVATTVLDDATGMSWTNSELAGAAAHDSATVNGQHGGIPAGGTLTFSFFRNSSCTGSATTTQTVTLDTTGAVPDSNSTGPLVAGNYAFQAGYNGDANYRASLGTCETFSAGLVATTLATTVID